MSHPSGTTLCKSTRPQEIPIRYINPVFRPPSEAQSLILPVTNGCSWNKCTYFEMYTEPQKKFAVREEQETLDAIARCAALYGGQLQRVFLGDGTPWRCPRGA